MLTVYMINYKKKTCKVTEISVIKSFEKEIASLTIVNVLKWHSFKNETEYRLTVYFIKNNQLKKSIISFLCNSYLKSFIKQLSFWNSNQLFLMWNKIIIDTFHITEIFIKSDINHSQHTYTLCYRNVIDVLCHLFDHMSFKKHLTYASMCHYNMKNERVYTDMHTDDW